MESMYGKKIGSKIKNTKKISQRNVKLFLSRVCSWLSCSCKIIRGFTKIKAKTTHSLNPILNPIKNPTVFMIIFEV